MNKSSRNESTRLFFYCEINSYFKSDITCFFVKVRSCLLAKALMRASRRMARPSALRVQTRSYLPILFRICATKAFSETYPYIQITLLEGGNKQVAKWLAEKSVDICLCAEPQDSGEYSWKELYRDPLVAWLPKNHPKVKQKTYKIKDLETEDFIHTLPGQDTDQDRLIKQEDLTLQTRFTTKDGFTTYQMVKAGLGVSFNQAMIARDWKEEVAQVPLRPKRFVSLGMALPKKEKVSPTVQRFMDCLEQWMVDYFL